MGNGSELYRLDRRHQWDSTLHTHTHAIEYGVINKFRASDAVSVAERITASEVSDTSGQLIISDTITTHHNAQQTNQVFANMFQLHVLAFATLGLFDESVRSLIVVTDAVDEVLVESVGVSRGLNSDAHLVTKI